MKNDQFTIQQFARSVVTEFTQKYPDAVKEIAIDENVSELEKMEMVLDYCVKKGYVLPELLEQFEE